MARGERYATCLRVHICRHTYTRCPYTEKTERRGMDERLLIGGDDVQACSASSPADGAPVLGVSSIGDASVSSAADGTPPPPSGPSLVV